MNSKSTEKVWILSFVDGMGEREIFGVYRSLDDAQNAYNNELLKDWVEDREPIEPGEYENVREAVEEELCVKIEEFTIHNRD